MTPKKRKRDVEAAEAGLEEQDAPAVEEVDEDPLARAERERDEAIANWQRARADYKNLNRRSLETIDAAVGRARTEVLGELLLVLDYLDMALMAECTGEEAKNLHYGVSLTRDQMLGVLERFEVKPIEELETFDPAIHQALSKVDDPERAEGEIVEVVRKGYRIGEQVLRHAQVHVVGVEEPSPAPADDEDTEEESSEEA
ncbi:MAG: nucleotide exchange factor GrpE [Planctomycetes bacterium]|nr:nucleotide exchange factor GrpE [Planctomycetota bacterium]